MKSVKIKIRKDNLLFGEGPLEAIADADPDAPERLAGRLPAGARGEAPAQSWLETRKAAVGGSFEPWAGLAAWPLRRRVGSSQCQSFARLPSSCSS